MAKKQKRAAEHSDKDESKLFAFLAAFLSIIGFVIALIVKRKDKYVMFYAKQSLVVFIAGAIFGIVSSILIFIPIIGMIIKVAANIIIFILWLLSWINALSGETKETPLVGKYARNINL
jgi:uncharacterized membrane protein